MRRETAQRRHIPRKTCAQRNNNRDPNTSKPRALLDTVRNRTRTVQRRPRTPNTAPNPSNTNATTNTTRGGDSSPSHTHRPTRFTFHRNASSTRTPQNLRPSTPATTPNNNQITISGGSQEQPEPSTSSPSPITPMTSAEKPWIRTKIGPAFAQHNHPIRRARANEPQQGDAGVQHVPPGLTHTAQQHRHLPTIAYRRSEEDVPTRPHRMGIRRTLAPRKRPHNTKNRSARRRPHHPTPNLKKLRPTPNKTKINPTSPPLTPHPHPPNKTPKPTTKPQRPRTGQSIPRPPRTEHQ